MTRPDQLAGMTVKELRALAAGRGVPGSAKMRKDELVAAIEKALLAPRQEPPAPPTTPTGSSSSAVSSTASQPAQAWQPAPPDHGLPVPSAYGHDRLVLMVQDPSHVFAYWEISPATLARVKAEAGGSEAAVLLLHTPAGAEQREVDLRGGNYYLAVAPGTAYTAELCLRGHDGRLHRLASSNRIATPAAGPSQRTDEAWMEVDESFADLMSLAGLPGSIGSSAGSRFRNTRLITARPVGVEAEGAAVAPPAEARLGGLSSAGLVHAAAGESAGQWSSHALSSHSVGEWKPQSSGALQSSGSLQSSRALSSRSLSSRSLSSGAIAGGTVDETTYPVDGVFHAPSTGLPKAAEGIPSTAGSAAAPSAGASPAPNAAAPAGPGPAPNAAAPAPAHDPLSFIGAPKAPAQRKPKPRRS